MKVTLTEVRDHLSKQIAMWINSYKERDGVVREKYVLRNIACLRKALRLLRKK